MSGWEKVAGAGGHISQVYLIEINRQARACKSACDRTLVLGERLRSGNPMSPTDFEELGERVEQAVSCAASLRNLIFGSGAPRDRKLKDFWKERTKWLQKLMENPVLPTIQNVSARNSLEHFDERMDTWAFEWAHRPAQEQGWIGAFDCIVKSRGDWGQAESSKELVRCYIADESMFVIRDDEVYIPELMKEANIVIRQTRRFNAAHTAMWKSTGASPQIIVPF